MSGSMQNVLVTGLISRIMNRYVITTDDGTQYELSAIYPWEAVSADYGSGLFAANLGKRMTATGLTDGHTIWKADLQKEEPAARGRKPASGPKRFARTKPPSEKK